jgi:hypothetical protein
MHCIVNYEIGTGRAFDEDGDEIQLEFCLVDTTNKTEAGFVVINGELHVCRDFELFINLLSFWVRPAPKWATLQNVVAIDSPPVATYETVCDVFNRLARLRHDSHSFNLYVSDTAITVWGLLKSMGVVIDVSEVEMELNRFGNLIDGSFNEWNVQALAVWLETTAQRLGGEA